MKNYAIREAAFRLDVKQWEIAKRLGISESVLCRKLRDDLSPEETEKVLSAIETIYNERKKEVV